MTTLFLDIETTGIPFCTFGRFPDYANLSKYENARAVQISWIVMKDNKILQDTNCIIKPNGFDISNSHIHGISQARALKEGMDIKTALKYFAEDCEEAIMNDGKLICHNVDFDLNIIKSEFHRANMPVDDIDQLHTFCTMKSACKPNQRWPKLVALYSEYFKETYPAHSALEDAYACLRCYHWLTQKIDMKDEIEQARKELE